MKIFVFEFVTGGGLLGIDTTERMPSSLRREGLAMVTALANDLARIGDVQVCASWDAREPIPPRQFSSLVHLYPVRTASDEAALYRRLARECDLVLTIAPETDDLLLSRARAAGASYCGPAAELIALAANKRRTTDHLRRRGVPVPRSWPLCELRTSAAWDNLTYPLVLKPVDGCGSSGLRLVRNAAELHAQVTAGPEMPVGAPSPEWIVEAFCSGTAASVAVLAGPGGCTALQPCEQRLSSDGRFAYLGGATMPRGLLSDRAQSLALRAVRSLPKTLGYLGVDLVLGARDDGGDDVVIEINPRLTTSYVGLRRATADNLAAALLAAVQGREVVARFGDVPIEFDAEGSWWPKALPS